MSVKSEEAHPPRDLGDLRGFHGRPPAPQNHHHIDRFFDMPMLRSSGRAGIGSGSRPSIKHFCQADGCGTELLPSVKPSDTYGGSLYATPWQIHAAMIALPLGLPGTLRSSSQSLAMPAKYPGDTLWSGLLARWANKVKR